MEIKKVLITVKFLSFYYYTIFFRSYYFVYKMSSKDYWFLNGT